MMGAGFRKWLAFGTGVAIEIGRDDLNVSVVRLRPSGARVLGELAIPGFRGQAADEWGASYAGFLQKLGVRHLAATVLLPRDEVTVRHISLPGVVDKDLPSAVRFELDSLNPYAEEDAAYDWARVAKSVNILIGMTRRATVERYSALLSQAGVKVASLTFSAAALYAALRVLSVPPPDGFVALAESGGEIEIYGEGPARPLFSARLSQPAERAASLAVAELRLPPETQPALLADALPRPVAAPPDYDPSRSALVYAAALASACPLPVLALNLLPPEQRQATSRLRYVPTAVLATLVLLMLVATLAYPRYADREYLALLDQQIRLVQPRARRSADLDREIAAARNRAQSLDNFRGHTREDLEALNSLTHLLAAPAWLTSLQMTRDSISIAGQTDQAAGLIKLLDGSPNFQNSAFALPIQRGQNGEVFNVHSARKGVIP
ncbi:MAG TPA: PilN domain-containing protein [Bryobacteraceae bacterium]|nr:PilN domain-containing protein [Bryobacteraceae bacterium]